MSHWTGLQDCRHYGGVKRVTEKVCCGGRKRVKVLLDCAIHKRIYASNCKLKVCGYYEKGANG